VPDIYDSTLFTEPIIVNHDGSDSAIADSGTNIATMSDASTGDLVDSGENTIIFVDPPDKTIIYDSGTNVMNVEQF
jgi:hypothetical protein